MPSGGPGRRQGCRCPRGQGRRGGCICRPRGRAQVAPLRATEIAAPAGCPGFARNGGPHALQARKQTIRQMAEDRGAMPAFDEAGAGSVHPGRPRADEAGALGEGRAEGRRYLPRDPPRGLRRRRARRPERDPIRPEPVRRREDGRLNRTQTALMCTSSSPTQWTRLKAPGGGGFLLRRLCRALRKSNLPAKWRKDRPSMSGTGPAFGCVAPHPPRTFKETSP